MALKFRNLFVSLTGLFCSLYACSGNSIRNDSNLPNSTTYQKITAETAYQMMQKSDGFVLLDVRSNEEFQEKHINGAILIPVSELEKRAEPELADKDAVILVYCRSGVRSANASKILVKKGYTQVFDFGGINSWPYETVRGK